MHKGCPLLPILFLLVVERLSRMIQSAVVDKKLKRINISTLVKITHLLFINDILLFSKGTFIEWKTFKDILDRFCLVLKISHLL